MSLFKNKNEINFFTLLANQCETCVDGTKELRRFMDLPEGVEKQESETAITGFEKKGDLFRRDLILGVQDAFITPVDREDLFILSRRIDDVIDQVDEIKDLIEIFNVTASGSMLEMVDLNVESTEALYKAVSELETSESETNLQYMLIAKKNENKVKRVYWKSILDLQEKNPTVADALQVRELCRELDQLANKIGRAADKMGEVKLKMIR